MFHHSLNLMTKTSTSPIFLYHFVPKILCIFPTHHTCHKTTETSIPSRMSRNTGRKVPLSLITNANVLNYIQMGISCGHFNPTLKNYNLNTPNLFSSYMDFFIFWTTFKSYSSCTHWFFQNSAAYHSGQSMHFSLNKQLKYNIGSGRYFSDLNAECHKCQA